MMEQISGSLLAQTVAAVAGSAAGEAGRQAWDSLTSLVRKAFGRGSDAGAALEEIRADPTIALPAATLADILTERAATDAAFGSDLRVWLTDARRIVRTGEGDVHNVISDSARVGQVIQGRDFHGPITFGTPPPRPGR